MSKKLLLVLGIVILVVVTLLLVFNQKPIIEKQDNLYRFSSEKEIYDSFKDRLSGYNVTMMADRAMVDASSGQEQSATGSQSYSETNIQVEGVDEADIIKTDGEYIYLITNRSDYSGVDGRGIYLNESELIIINSQPNSEIISKTKFNDFYANEIFVHDDKIVLFGTQNIPYDYRLYQEDEGFQSAPVSVDGGSEGDDKEVEDVAVRSIMPYIPTMQMATIKVIDISNKADPVILKSLDFEGYYLTSRKIDDSVYFVINAHPRFYALERYSCEDIAPLYRDSTNDSNKELEPVVPCNQIGYISPVQAESFLTMVGLSLNDLSLDKEVIVGSGSNVYASKDNIYIVQTTWPRFNNAGEVAENYTQESVITKFSLDDGKINYQTTGRVKGYVLNQFSMDEHNGYFRIATTSQDAFGFPIAEPLMIDDMDVEEIPVKQEDLDENLLPEEPRREEPIVPDEEIRPDEPVMVSPRMPTTKNHLFVLDESLEVVGSVNDIAPGERIYSARFMGDKAYMVTFVQVDPLFVIDLENPQNPRILGELKIPGYSNYLHPYSENYLIGIGKEVLENEDPNDTFVFEQGIKLSIFDVTDLENPIELYKEVIGDRGTYSNATQDHKAFLFDKEKNLLIIPITLAQFKEPPQNRWEYGQYTFQGMYVYDVDIESGFNLRGRVTHYDEDSINTREFEMHNFFGDGAVKRALYIGDVLYTFSNNRLQLNNLSSLDLLKKINLN